MVLVPTTTGNLSWMRSKKGREGCAVITPGELQSMALRKDSLGEDTPWWPRCSMERTDFNPGSAWVPEVSLHSSSSKQERDSIGGSQRVVLEIHSVACA